MQTRSMINEVHPSNILQRFWLVVSSRENSLYVLNGGADTSSSATHLAFCMHIAERLTFGNLIVKSK